MGTGAIISDNEDNIAVESDVSLDEDFIQESDHDSLSEQDILSKFEVEVFQGYVLVGHWDFSFTC